MERGRRAARQASQIDRQIHRINADSRHTSSGCGQEVLPCSATKVHKRTLANIMEDGPGLPMGNTVRRNVVCRSGAIGLSAQAAALGTVGDNLETGDDPGFAANPSHPKPPVPV